MKANRFFVFLTTLLFFLHLTFTGGAQRIVNLGDFDEVSVTGNIELRLQEGTAGAARIETENIPEDEVSVKVSNGKLKLSVTSSLFYKNERIQVTVTYRTLHAVRAAAGATIVGDGEIEADELLVRATAGSRISLAVNVNNLDAGVGEGGHLIIAGQAVQQEVNASTGGKYDGLDLECEQTSAKASTGGEAQVVARDYLDANVTMGGSVFYRGEPKDKDTKIVLSGTIERIREE